MSSKAMLDKKTNIILASTVFLHVCFTCSVVSAYENEVYKGAIKKVAILPLRNLSGRIADELKLRKALADVLRSKKNIVVLDLDYSDKYLAEKGLLVNGNIKIENLRAAREGLHVDGILRGNITTYYIPSQEEKAAGLLIPLVDAVAKVEAKLRFYDCTSSKMIWERLIIGYSKPFVLKIESLAINMDSAIDSFKRNFDWYWLRKQN